MTPTEERIRILEMIQSGQITIEEGNRLLEALKGEGHAGSLGKGPQQLRIRITDLETGQQKADIRLPWNLVKVGFDMGARFAHDEITPQDFSEAVQSGAEGKIMDVVDEEEGERVEIFVE
jgi:hypothetical protein